MLLLTTDYIIGIERKKKGFSGGIPALFNVSKDVYYILDFDINSDKVGLNIARRDN